MTKNKRFTSNNGVFYKDNETGWEFQSYGEVVELLNKLNDENEKLKEENKMLKITISRNESYIDRLTHKGEWRTNSDETDL